MISKNDLQRISEFVWQVPREYRADMRVPARMYADEELLDDALQDKSVEQLMNTATLPGIVKYAIAMPDIHAGYGAPVGGVFATNAQDGVISPGAVGYDINCIAGNSRILHEYGYTHPIVEMAKSWREAQIICQDFSNQRATNTQITRYLKQLPKSQVYRVCTAAGDEIIATADHPFWTPRGMIELGQLRHDDQVAIFPFQGVPYQEPSARTLVTEQELLPILHANSKTGSHGGIQKTINGLYERGLVPLRCDSIQFPRLLKVMGFVLGDGVLNFHGERNQGNLFFYGTPQNLEHVRADMIALGFGPTAIKIRQRTSTIVGGNHEYTFQSKTAEFQVASTGLVALFAALGIPLGRRANQNFEIPTWLFDLPLWQKRLWLAALFGAELSLPSVSEAGSHGFRLPALPLSKHEGFVESGYHFLQGIQRLLSEFDVQCNGISEEAGRTVLTDGKTARTLRLRISSADHNLINLWSRVGIEYNTEHKRLAYTAVQFLKLKSQALQVREHARDRAVTMYGEGMRPSEITKQLDGVVNFRFVERSVYTNAATHAIIGRDFPKFEEYGSSATNGLGNSGMVWDTLATIESIEWNEPVYDFTVAHRDHNFIANGFVVSNCGVRVLASHVHAEEIQPQLKNLATTLYRNCPSGVGVSGSVNLGWQDLDEILNRGADWTLERGYARMEDLPHTEEYGRIPYADANQVSDKAKERGRDQLGTLGAGNHFIEVDRISAIYDEDAARVLGLFENQVVVQIHCGSRGLGHQVCQDYVDKFQRVVKEYNIVLPDRELVAAPFTSPEGQAYVGAMGAAANFAFANRQVLAFHIRRSFAEALKGHVHDFDLHQVYDIAHNMAKVEDHDVDGTLTQVLVHRKGATRAFGPNSPVLPDDLKEIGQPVLIPGSMGTMSFILCGTAGSMAQTFGSSCHGAGRVWSRHRAKKEIRGEKLRAEMQDRGIEVRAGSLSGLAEEAPQAYKDVSRVVQVVDAAGIGKMVAKLEPMAVIKG